MLQSTGSTFCLHTSSFSEAKEDRRRLLDGMHAREIATGRLTPVLSSSIRLRTLMNLRKKAWTGLP